MKNYIILLVILLGINVGFSQQYTLKQAIDYALKNNLNISNANYEIEKANQKVKETRSIGLPQVNAEGGFNHFLDIATTVAPAQAFNPLAPPDAVAELQFGTEFNTSATITASQLIFDGAYLVALQTTKKFKALSQLQKIKSEQDVKEAVTNAYYNVLVSKESIKTIEELVETSSKILEDTKKMYDIGVIEKDNVDQLNLSVLNAKSALSSAKNRLEIAKKMLKYEMGLLLDSPIEAASSFEEVVNTVKNVGLNTKGNTSENMDVQLLKAQMELNILNIKYEKRKGLPRLSAFFSHQQAAFRNDFDFFQNKPWYPTTIWGIKLQAPLWASGLKSSLVKQAEFEVKKTENQLSLIEEGLKLQQSNAETTYLNALDNYNLQDETVKTSKRIFDRHQIKYREGIISSMELTQSQSQYVNSQNRYIQAMYELIQAKLQLDKLNNNL